MIKRMRKATSLLIAAAAVVSLIPATGVSAAEKLQTKDGTIDTAIAFDGGYIYKGYKSDSDETSVYYNKGGQDAKITDVDDLDAATRYGSKYVQVNSDGDDYLVDITTGKVIDDETIADKEDTVKTKLKSILSKTDRYGKVNTTDDVEIKSVSENQFGDLWYSYTTTGSAATHSGYVNDAGKYIDTDQIANIYVFNGTKMVKVEEFGKENKDYKIKADLVGATTLAQDKDNIYRAIDVLVTNNAGASATTSSAVYIQKISKVQGNEEDGAYLPKTVASYQVTNAFDSDDADDANKTLDTNSDSTVTLSELDGFKFRVINGALYGTKINDAKDQVTVTTFKLKKDKVAVNSGSTKFDVYLAEQDANKDQDIMGENAVSIDVDGNTWALNKGEVLKFDGTEFKTVYNVDRAFDTLEVYNADSLIAWQDGEDAYATVDKNVDAPTDETPVVQKGWVNTNAGWTFYNNDGSQAKGKWINDNGTWYMIKADGIMVAGWYNDNGTWYYLNGSGAMKTGWLNDNGTWYYLNGSGAMKTGWLNDNGTWYYLNGSGAMKTGWLNDNGTWYFLNASGVMLANTTVDGYRLGASGAWVK